MRSICKKGSATLVAVLALCAVAAASASAAELYVGGKALSGTAAFAQTPKVEGSITIWSPGYHFKITCTGIDIENGGSKEISDLVAPGSAMFWNLTYEKCKLSEPSNCEFLNGEKKGEGPIWEPKLEGTLTKGTGSEDTMTIRYGTASGDKLFGYFEARGCASMEGLDVLGFAEQKQWLILSMPTGQTESTEQALVFPGEKEKLEFLRNTTYVSGSFKLKLASGEKWSFR